MRRGTMPYKHADVTCIYTAPLTQSVADERRQLIELSSCVLLPTVCNI
jgi:hypothetical protein